MLQSDNLVAFALDVPISCCDMNVSRQGEIFYSYQMFALGNGIENYPPTLHKKNKPP